MKKILSVLLAATLILGVVFLVACGKEDDATTKTTMSTSMADTSDGADMLTTADDTPDATDAPDAADDDLSSSTSERADGESESTVAD